MGFLDLDLPCDIRDIIADVRNLAKADDIKLDMIAMLALDLIGVIPVIGALKYSDEIGTLFKSADKVSVVTRSTDGAGVLAKMCIRDRANIEFLEANGLEYNIVKVYDNGVRVGVIRTNGRISTIFPDAASQP